MSYSAQFDITRLAAPGSKYSVEEKMSACFAYITTGNSYRASEISGVPSHTIRKWKNESPWWDMAVIECRLMADKSLDAALTGGITKTVDQILDRLAKGNKKRDPKTGDEYFEPVPAHQLASVLQTLYDKRALIRGEATSRTETISSQDVIKKVKDDLEKLYYSQKESKHSA